MARTTADRLRAHREAFQLAQQLGCTPREAEHQLRARAARADWEGARRRIEAGMAKPPRLRGAAQVNDEEAQCPRFWWLRD